MDSGILISGGGQSKMEIMKHLCEPYLVFFLLLTIAILCVYIVMDSFTVSKLMDEHFLLDERMIEIIKKQSEIIERYENAFSLLMEENP